MEINIHDSGRAVDIWLTREEQADESLRAQVRGLCGGYAKQDYAVAVFFSGREDPVSETGALLSYNRRRSAEQAVRRERAGGRQARR